MSGERFRDPADELARSRPVVIDRPAGSRYPVWQGTEYPLDYGYLAGTRAPDGGGIDVWLSTGARDRVTGAIATIDARKGDAELKLLLGCTAEEARRALAMHDAGSQAGVLMWRDPKGQG